MTQPAQHPPTCQVCHGSGWQIGPDTEVRSLHGEVLRIYRTVTPCTHHWTDDDPTPDDVISLDEYLARHHDEHLEHARQRHPTAQ